MTIAMNQFELFGAPEEKSYSAYGVELPYWEENGRITQVALSDNLMVPVTYQKGGHIYTDVPRYGRVDYRGKNAKTSFLSHLANLRRALGSALELNESIVGHGQSLVRDAKAQGELVRAAKAESLALKAENTRVADENARLRDELAQVRGELESKPSGPINTTAVRWAFGQKGLSALRRLVLIALAMHADRNFLTFVSAETVSRETGMHRDSVRVQTTALLEYGIIHDTGERRGTTSQVKVFKLLIFKGAGNPAPLKRRRSLWKLGTNEERTTLSSDNVVVVDAQPDDKRAQLLTLAATAADLSELAGKLKPFFPLHDVALQLRRCRDWRRKQQLVEPEPTARAFIDWMLGAEKPLPPPKHKPPPAAPASLIAPEQVDPDQLARFQKEREERKARKAVEQPKR